VSTSCSLLPSPVDLQRWKTSWIEELLGLAGLCHAEVSEVSLLARALNEPQAASMCAALRWRLGCDPAGTPAVGRAFMILRWRSVLAA